jgi:4,5-DOPA dioxygenase extradiol
MFPEADVPVIQLALDAGKSYDDHFALGAALAPLRERGVLIVGSGNVVHNLRRVDWSQPEAAFDWSERFDEEARLLMTSDPASVARLADHRDHALAVPTPDHFLPLLYIAALAAAAGDKADVLVGGYAMGSLSMTAYSVGAATRPSPRGPAPPVLPTGDVPPADTNT